MTSAALPVSSHRMWRPDDAGMDFISSPHYIGAQLSWAG